VKKVWKSVMIWQSINNKYGVSLIIEHGVYIHRNLTLWKKLKQQETLLPVKIVSTVETSCTTNPVTGLQMTDLVRSLEQSSRGEYPQCLKKPKFLYNTMWIDDRKPPRQNAALVVQSFRYNTGLWRTDGRTHDDNIYRASIASHGKNQYNQNK